MPRLAETLVYYVTAPIRLFGRSRAFRFALRWLALRWAW